MPYLPIEQHGVIGNMRTVALVGRNGCIDWFCFPDFDSPSVFAAILDDQRGGRFSICMDTADPNCKQLYWPDTNVLVTRFLSNDGVVEIVDYMPIGEPRAGGGFHGLIRRVRAIRGEVRLRMLCEPAFNYARDSHTTELAEGGARFISANLTLGLASTVPLRRTDLGVAAEFTLREGASTSFELHALNEDLNGIGIDDDTADRLFRATVKYWRDWLSHCTYRGRWREMVNRSALVLKLLTFAPTGAIVAAPTCSLPESLGGARNWDYRYTWIRDSAFTVYALLRIGFTEEAAAFMSFLDARCHEIPPDGSLQIMYGIDGRHELTEETLPHLEGYRGSAPVRVGNGAYNQLQLDIYGELMDSVYLFNKYGTPISYDLWRYLSRLTNWVCDHWQEPDEAIWEVRGGRQHFTYSKLMCWVAVDRGASVQGRVAVAIDAGQVWLLWLREAAGKQSLWLARYAPDLAKELQRTKLADLQGTGRATGFPRIALGRDAAYVVWTDVVAGTPQLNGVRIVAGK